MTLFFTLLPLYLLGNLHCLGMCGPLVMMIGQHRYRHLYFLGRTLSFSLAGMLAGEIGQVVNLLPFAAATSFLFGVTIIVLGLAHLLSIRMPAIPLLATISQRLSLLLLKETPLTTLLFGLSTVLLPCGQTLIVFSACALSASAWTGLFNGFAFALLTSPSLFFAMKGRALISRFKTHANTLMGLAALVVGLLALLRGLADLGSIPHFSLIPKYHVILY